MRIISLDGVWKASGSGEGESIAFSGIVPGCVHTDLLKEKKLDELFWRDNAEKAQWIERWDWKYKTEFSLEKVEAPARLEFDGLDTYCDVYLNGVHLGYCDDMFRPWQFEVSRWLQQGANQLEVYFYSPIKRVEGKPPRSAAFTTERVYTRRMQCTYGWDWVGRFVTCGIFKSVRLCFPEAAELEHAYVYTKNIDSYSAQVGTDFQFALYQPGAFAEITVIDPQGKMVFEKRRRIVEEEMRECIEITDPQLWFPNGYGAQPLYTLCVQIIYGEKTVDAWRQQFGVRTVKLLQKQDLPGSPWYEKCKKLQKGEHLTAVPWDRNEQFSGFLIVVNGTPIMCKGANWVPCEPFPSAETPDKITELLTLFQEGNANLVRVWGGGIFEQDFFYEECDRLGLMVTQDFLMACGSYPEQEEWFLKKLTEEAAFAAKRLRNHPSLIFWSGDNENAVAGDENDAHYQGRRAAMEGLWPALKSFDPHRPFLESSPYGGVPYASATCGTTHNTQFLESLFQYIQTSDLKDYRTHLKGLLARFVMEEPCMGASPVVSLQKFMTDEDIWGQSEEMWRYHTKNNPFLKPLALYDYIRIFCEKVLGSFKNGEDRVWKMEYLQYEWIRLTMENFRRSKWFSGGLVYWMLDDCWPSAGGWSLLDYYALPKAGYYAFKRAAKPVIASIDCEGGLVSVWVCNDSVSQAVGEFTLFAQSAESGERTELKKGSFQSEANRAQLVFQAKGLPVDGNELLLCELTWAEGTDRAVLYPQRPCDLRYTEPKIRVLARTAEEITVLAESFVPAVILSGEYVFEDNYFTMLPGEQRSIAYRKAFQSAGGKIDVQARAF